MTKRELSEGEKKLSLSSIAHHNENIMKHRWTAYFSQGMLSMGLRVNYDNQMNEHRSKLRDANEAILHAQKIILNCEAEIREGVERKE